MRCWAAPASRPASRSGKTYPLADIVARAFADSGLTVEDWNGLDDETRATKIDIVLDALDAGEIVLAQPPKRTRKAK